MPKAWTKEETEVYRKSLYNLYVVENLTILEIAKIMKVAPQTVFDRLGKVKIKTKPHLKPNYQNRRSDIEIPNERSKELAEFFGIMLGDGHLSKNQVMVTLGSKENLYVKHVSKLMANIFGVRPNTSTRKAGYKDVYLGSVKLSAWCVKEGLVFNKVRNQVGVPKWILKRDEFMISFLKGFFDTDGSVYKIRHGIQISFTNRSLPILKALRKMLIIIGYSPSNLSVFKIYLTKSVDVHRFFKEIRPANIEKIKKFSKLLK